MMKPVHTAPIFRCNDRVLLDRFCRRYGIHPRDGQADVIEQCARAFSALPYENLTKIIRSDSVLSPSSALRYPAEVLADHLKWGTGGTCFSLTAALIAVFNELGFNAQPLLADRYYGPDTHCGLVVMHEDRMLLIDPGYLLFEPTPLPEVASSMISLDYTNIELRPSQGGSRVELATIVRGNRKVRLTYKRFPVDAAAFRRAWVGSFTWEMMTYPVLARCSAGRHLYFQGTSASVRTSEKTERFDLGPSEQFAFISENMGVAGDVVLKAWEVIRHGAA
jgi:hypothetical protein